MNRRNFLLSALGFAGGAAVIATTTKTVAAMTLDAAQFAPSSALGNAIEKTQYRDDRDDEWRRRREERSDEGWHHRRHWDDDGDEEARRRWYWHRRREWCRWHPGECYER
jgi:hypothetical protein